jgi:hypothetical protein
MINYSLRVTRRKSWFLNESRSVNRAWIDRAGFFDRKLRNMLPEAVAAANAVAIRGGIYTIVPQQNIGPEIRSNARPLCTICAQGSILGNVLNRKHETKCSG